MSVCSWRVASICVDLRVHMQLFSAYLPFLCLGGLAAMDGSRLSAQTYFLYL